MAPCWDSSSPLSVQGAPIWKIHSPKPWPSVWKGALLSCCCCPHSSHSSFRIYLQAFPWLLSCSSCGWHLYPVSITVKYLSFFFELWLLSLSWTFFPVSYGIILMSDLDSLHELVLQISPWEAQGWNLLRGQCLMVLLPRRKRKPKELWHRTQSLEYELKA